MCMHTHTYPAQPGLQLTQAEPEANFASANGMMCYSCPFKSYQPESHPREEKQLSPNPFYLILMIYDWIQVNATFLNTCSITGIKKHTSNFTKTERHETAVLLKWNLQTEKWGQFHLILQRTKPNVFMITRITNGRDTILNPNTQMKTCSSLQFTTAKSLLLFGVRRAFSQTLCLWDSSEVPKERQQRPSFVKSAARLFQRNKCKGTHKGRL